MPVDDVYQWYYLSPRHTVAHALGRVMAGRAAAAVCGIGPPFATWLGTGSQHEYERAAALPRCKRCARKVTGR